MQDRIISILPPGEKPYIRTKIRDDVSPSAQMLTKDQDYIVLQFRLRL
jgi:hypothetical protein